MDYDIEVTGPTPNVLVDVSGWASASFGSNVAVHVNSDLIFYSLGNGGKNAKFDMTVSLPTDSPIEVVLNANAGGNVGSGLMSAYIDPYFSIDTSNAEPGAYSILTSPGIGNSPSPGVPGTPETSTWEMMLFGVIGLGWAGWRRRGSPVAVGV